MNKNILTMLVSLLVIAIGAEAQSNTKKFGIEINGGIREYHGDLGSSLYFKKAPNYQAVGGALGMYLNSSFDVNIYGSTGDLGFYKESWDILKAEPYRQGFRSHITEGMIGVTFKLNNGTIMSEDATFKPFIRAGWGVVKSISKFSEGSTLVGDAETYYYASRDRSWLASHWNAAAGFKIGLTDALDLVVSEQVNYSFDDNYDGAPFAIAGARLNSASEGNKPLHDITYITTLVLCLILVAMVIQVVLLIKLRMPTMTELVMHLIFVLTPQRDTKWILLVVLWMMIKTVLLTKKINVQILLD